ncbi:MAG: hypothetical protein ACREU3_05230 [Steroidobacteraceae bacterium]
MADRSDGLTYFTHEIQGRLYAGWYRRLAGGRIEVFTRTRAHTEFLGTLAIEEQAKHMLEALVAEDEVSARPGDDQSQLSPTRRKK